MHLSRRRTLGASTFILRANCQLVQDGLVSIPFSPAQARARWRLPCASALLRSSPCTTARTRHSVGALSLAFGRTALVTSVYRCGPAGGVWSTFRSALCVSHFGAGVARERAGDAGWSVVELVTNKPGTRSPEQCSACENTKLAYSVGPEHCAPHSDSHALRR